MKTTKQFKKEVYLKYGTEYQVLGNYNGSKIKIQMHHFGGCGKKFFATPSNILQGHLCPFCRKSEKKTDELFKLEVFKKVNDEYTFLEPYKTVRIKLKVRHNKCGYEYFVRPDKFLSGQRCPKCQKVLQYTTETFKEKIKEITSGYILLSDYVNNKTPVNLKHEKCGTIFSILPREFVTGRRCPNCIEDGKIERRKKRTEKFQKFVYQTTLGKYSIIEDYRGENRKIKFLHICKRNFYLTPKEFRNGERCPFCFDAQNEKKIYFILKNLDLNFTQKKMFINCTNAIGRQIPFSFFLDDYNIIIEYQRKISLFPIIGERILSEYKKNIKIKKEFVKNEKKMILYLPF